MSNNKRHLPYFRKWSVSQSIGSIVSTKTQKIALALLTSAFLVLSFPNPDQGWMAWFALVPLILACHGLRPIRAFILGLLSGLASTFGIFYWIFEVPGFGIHHMLIGALYFALYPAAWCAWTSIFRRIHIPLIITAPSLWVALDYLKAHAGFMAFPWATLAHTQHNNLAVLQIASLAGEYGITFLVVMGSITVVQVILHRRWRSIFIAGGIIGLTHVWGFYEFSQPATTAMFKVTVVQPSILLSERKTVQGGNVSFERLERLTQSAAAKQPMLIAWPETAVRDLPNNPEVAKRLFELAKAINTNLIVGASEFMKFPPPEGENSPQVRSYNSAYFIRPDKPIGIPYQKMVLLPFGEYLPLENIIEWPTWLVPKVFKQIPGKERRYFELPNKVRFGVLICWENLFADFVRPSIREGANLLVQLTNDNWFGRTAAPRQHNLASVLRAVENRVPLLISSNTGPSEVIDQFGRNKASVPNLFTEGVAIAEVTPGHIITFYTCFGDLFAFACIVIVLVSISLSVLRKR